MTIIEKKRQERGYTQQYMAEAINVSVGCYNMYENNQRKIPKNKAEKIAQILDCKICEIFMPSSFTVCEIKNDLHIEKR